MVLEQLQEETEVRKAKKKAKVTKQSLLLTEDSETE